MPIVKVTEVTSPYTVSELIIENALRFHCAVSYMRLQFLT